MAKRPRVASAEGEGGMIDEARAASTLSRAASFRFSADQAGAGFDCALDGAAFAPCTSPQAYSELAPGSHSFRVRATDAAGNVDASPATT
jgi:large repetitive protein